jgi:VanZ family protein
MTSTQDGARRQPYRVSLPLCIGLIALLSSLPHRESIDPFYVIHHSDKVEHAMAYGLLAFVCYRTFRSSSSVPVARNAGAVTLFLVLGFGVLCEWFQALLPSRSADGWDILADSVGSFFAIWITSSFSASASNTRHVIVRGVSRTVSR